MIGDVGVAHGKPAFDERLHLRHAETRRHPRRAAAARADADLDAVGAALEQKLRAFGGGDVARNHLRVAEAFPELGDRALHHDRVAVRDVDDDDVDVRAKQLRRRARDSRRSRRLPRRRAAGPGCRASQTACAAAARRSRAVISPIRRPSAVTSGSFLIFRSTIRRSAASGSIGPSWTTSRARGRHAIGHARSPRATRNACRARSADPSAAGVVDDDQRADARARHQRGRLLERRVRRECSTDRG